MQIETTTFFRADDGKLFSSQDACERYEAKRAIFRAELIQKIGEYRDSELMLGGHALLKSLPFEAPWLSAFGACSIYVTDVRRVNGVLEFQLADQQCVPYDNGNAWCKAEDFYEEWSK